MSVEFLVEILVAALLVVTVGYCWQLNRRLGALRGAQGELGRLLQEFGRATHSAEAAIAELKKASGETAQQLEELRDELDAARQAAAADARDPFRTL